MLELKKDISSPAGYWRAGIKKTKEEWEEEFPGFSIFQPSEWFIDLDEPQPVREMNICRQIVDAVFKRHGLRSISYKEAAEECIEEYIKTQTK